MKAMLGNSALTLALSIALLVIIFPYWGSRRHDRRWMALATPLTYAMSSLLLLACGTLAYGLVVNDFSLSYVVEHSHSTLPVRYRLAALWAGHEGSLLVWQSVLAGWMVAVARLQPSIPLEIRGHVLAILGGIQSGLLVVVLFTANPFLRPFGDFPLEGKGLNPLLQDSAVLWHPPLLYLGYGGFAVPYAFALATLFYQEHRRWVSWIRPWAVVAWVSLTLGIAVGSYWAYYELGWGGWWFWDPVENVALLPWLAAIALLHVQRASMTRGVLVRWTRLLAILTFSLALLGIFLLRSGLLLSVHAFANDATRGGAWLLYVCVVVGGALMCYALKGGGGHSLSRYAGCSRESVLGLASVIVMAALLVVLLATLLPLGHRLLGLGEISIGAPFFNTVFFWLMCPLALVLGAGALIRWQRDHWRRLWVGYVIAGGCALMFPWLLSWWMGTPPTLQSVVGSMMALWISVLTLLALLQDRRRDAGVRCWLRSISCRRLGRCIAHLGVAVSVLGITFSEGYSQTSYVRMKVGDSVQRYGYQLTLRAVEQGQRVNYQYVSALVEVTGDGRFIRQLQGEKRYYPRERVVTTEVALEGSVWRDLYIVLGEALAQGEWSLRIDYKPLIRWIWGGAVLMALGGLVALLEGGRRRSRQGIAC